MQAYSPENEYVGVFKYRGVCSGAGLAVSDKTRLGQLTEHADKLLNKAFLHHLGFLVCVSVRPSGWKDG